MAEHDHHWTSKRAMSDVCCHICMICCIQYLGLQQWCLQRSLMCLHALPQLQVLDCMLPVVKCHQRLFTGDIVLHASIQVLSCPLQVSIPSGHQSLKWGHDLLFISTVHATPSAAPAPVAHAAPPLQAAHPVSPPQAAHLAPPPQAADPAPPPRAAHPAPPPHAAHPVPPAQAADPVPPPQAANPAPLSRLLTQPHLPRLLTLPLPPRQHPHHRQPLLQRAPR